MKEQIKKINQMVADGKLSPEDAADLIESLMAEPPKGGPTSPPNPPNPPAPPKDVIAGFFQELEKIARDGKESVDWNAMSDKLKQTVKKGREAVRETIDEMSKGKVNFGFLSASEGQTFELPLMVPEGKALRIDNAAGNISVSGGHAIGAVRANVVLRGATLEDARAKLAEYQLVLEESDYHVTIRQPDMTGIEADLQIQVNGHPMVEVRAESGDVTVRDTKNGVKIHTRSGDLTLSGLNGPIEINAASGDITVKDSETPALSLENKSGDITLENLTGNINARTASGDVTGSGLKSKVIALEAVSGDVTLTFEQPIQGNVNLRTVSGDVEVTVPADSNARVALSTLRGDIHCDLELQDRHDSEQRVTGSVGSGLGSIDVSAVTGNISVHTS